MEYNKLIAELHTGDDVEGFYVLKDAFFQTAKLLNLQSNPTFSTMF